MKSVIIQIELLRPENDRGHSTSVVLPSFDFGKYIDIVF
jgi:hypothetical protein